MSSNPGTATAEKTSARTIAVGETIPSAKLTIAAPDGPKETTTEEVFKGRKVVLFGVPGAFTPTCSARHLPGFLENSAFIRDKGVDTVACMAVNDAFVLAAWAAQQNAGDKLIMLADGSAAFTKALGLELDLTARGLGIRCQRFALVAENMRVTHLAIEPPGGFDVSKAESILAAL